MTKADRETGHDACIVVSNDSDSENCETCSLENGNVLVVEDKE